MRLKSEATRQVHGASRWRLWRLFLAGLVLQAGFAAHVAGNDQTTSYEGHLLVLNGGDGTLSIVEVPSHRVVATVDVGAEPVAVAATPDGRKAYVVNRGDAGLTVVDLESRRVSRTLRPGGVDSPQGVGVSERNNHLLLTSEGSHRLYLLDTNRDVVLRTVTTTQAGLRSVAVRRGGRRAYVANHISGTMTVVDLPDLRILRHVEVGSGLEDIATSSDGRWIAVALRDSDEVAVLKSAGRKVSARVPAGARPGRVSFVPDSSTVLVSSRQSGDVTVVDVETHEVRTTVTVGGGPTGITTNTRGTLGYVCNQDAGTVTVFSIPGFEVQERIAVGRDPVDVTFVPRRGSS